MQANKRKPGRPPIYPWNLWLSYDGPLTLEKGKDFNCETQSLVILARRQAKSMSRKVHIKVRGLTVTIEVK